MHSTATVAMEMVCKCATLCTFPEKAGSLHQRGMQLNYEVTGNFGIGTRMSSVQKMDYALRVPMGMGVAGASTLTLKGETK